MDLSKTGKTIAKLRRSAGFTQASLAEKLGISDKAVSKWERGIACPDVSLWNKLSILLDTDIESLIYGHEEKNEWIGVLILDEYLSGDNLVYDKPLIHYLISQFILVGIKEIYIVGDCSIPSIPYISITVLKKLNQRFTKKAFVIYGNQYLYGPNLTRHFERAMSRNELTIIGSIRKKGEYQLEIDADRLGKSASNINNTGYYALPYVFYPRNQTILDFDVLIKQSYHVELLERGMVYFNVISFQRIIEMAQFINYMQDNTGESISNLDEIMAHRGFGK